MLQTKHSPLELENKTNMFLFKTKETTPAKIDR